LIKAAVIYPAIPKKAECPKLTCPAKPARRSQLAAKIASIMAVMMIVVRYSFPVSGMSNNPNRQNRVIPPRNVSAQALKRLNEDCRSN
jgi:hypothetical protein